MPTGDQSGDQGVILNWAFALTPNLQSTWEVVPSSGPRDMTQATWIPKANGESVWSPVSVGSSRAQTLRQS